jgi:hypothetical protein
MESASRSLGSSSDTNAPAQRQQAEGEFFSFFFFWLVFSLFFLQCEALQHYAFAKCSLLVVI